MQETVAAILLILLFASHGVLGILFRITGITSPRERK
jgi:hypothetical protein